MDKILYNNGLYRIVVKDNEYQIVNRATNIVEEKATILAQAVHLANSYQAALEEIQKDPEGNGRFCSHIEGLLENGEDNTNVVAFEPKVVH